MSLVAQKRDFQLIAGHPALDLVNTLDWRFRDSGAEELLVGYEDILRFAAQSELLEAKRISALQRTDGGPASLEALTACHALREAAAEVFYAAVDGRTPQPVALQALDGMFKEARRHQQLAWESPRLQWQWSAGEPDLNLPVWVLSSCVSRLLLSDDMQRVRTCEAPDCRWLFLDTSKNHTRRWCDMRLCGNRMKARRFKAQHRG